ncbi:MAG: alginate lyase family protein [Rickettsiales bacterium]|nr:alginate lyase family protein [Rickettsiales bacterium]
MPILKPLLLVIALCSVAAPSLATNIAFDVNQRKAELQTPAYAKAKEYCLAKNVKWDGKIPSPIKGLKTTDGYGSDNRPASFSWYTMILGGRVLAGDQQAAKDLKLGLLKWAKAKALTQSDTKHDTYYALKRYLLPVVISLGIIDDQLSNDERRIIVSWLDSIIPKLDKKFEGDVDHNNHRYLADSILMAWGVYKKDQHLIQIGRNGFQKALREMRADGSLPLETRRGARATWYMRHALSSLITVAEIDKFLGGSLYQARSKRKSVAALINYFVTASYAPLIILPYAAQNYIPGPGKDYLAQDRDYMRLRGHDRHYMAFAEAYIQQPTLAAKRLHLLMKNETKWRHRPYIDEYVGGNASCFYWQPGENS